MALVRKEKVVGTTFWEKTIPKALWFLPNKKRGGTECAIRGTGGALIGAAELFRDPSRDRHREREREGGEESA